MSDPQPWHLLFGLSWSDCFEGTAGAVETEGGMSLKQQYLALVLIRKQPGPLPRRLPDGFEELATHNLVTFKSHQETLDCWALWEPIGHYVNYRKQSSPSLNDLLPETEYRLFAVCARFPNKLAQDVPLTCVQEGVFEARFGPLRIRIIVVGQLPREKHNAMLHLFSANEEALSYGRQHYRPRSRETSTILYKLFTAYAEDPEMSEKVKEFARQVIDELLSNMPAEELRRRLSAAERLEGLPPEERVKGLPPEERVKGLPPEERLKGLSAEDVLRALSPEVREALARELKTPKTNGASPKVD